MARGGSSVTQWVRRVYRSGHRHHSSRLRLLLLCSAVVVIVLACFDDTARLDAAAGAVALDLAQRLRLEHALLLGGAWPPGYPGKPVAEWGCPELQAWLLSQGWQWPQAGAYARRLCDLGVTGRTLHLVDEEVLARDVGVRYAFHQRLLLERLRALQQQQQRNPFPFSSFAAASTAREWDTAGALVPVAQVAAARDSAVGPSTNALVFAGMLCCPRLTAAWLYAWGYWKQEWRPQQHMASLGPAPVQQPTAPSDSSCSSTIDSRFGSPLAAAAECAANSAVPGPPKPPGSSSALTAAATPKQQQQQQRTPDLLPAWLVVPGLCTALAALRHAGAHPLFALYAAAIGALRTLGEAHMVVTLVTGWPPRHALGLGSVISGTLSGAGGGMGSGSRSIRGSSGAGGHMPPHERAVRLACSHALMPAVCCLWGLLLKAIMAWLLPQWAGLLACWACCLLLPAWTVWGCFEVWDGSKHRPPLLHRHSSRRRVDRSQPDFQQFQQHFQQQFQQHFQQQQQLGRQQGSFLAGGYSRHTTSSGSGGIGWSWQASADGRHSGGAPTTSAAAAAGSLRQGQVPPPPQQQQQQPHNHSRPPSRSDGAGHGRTGGGVHGSVPQGTGTGRVAERAGSGGTASDSRGRSSSSSSLLEQKKWPPPLEIPERLRDHPRAPASIRCPITLSVMACPAQTPSGVSYERDALARWLDRRRCDPLTRAPLKRRHVSPNLALRSVIEQWVEDVRRVEARAAARGGSGRRAPPLPAAPLGSGLAGA